MVMLCILTEYYQAVYYIEFTGSSINFKIQTKIHFTYIFPAFVVSLLFRVCDSGITIRFLFTYVNKPAIAK